jgi:signal transduction histidine kinase
MQHGSTSGECGGIAITCSADGTILRVNRDDFNALPATVIGQPFPVVVHRDSMKKALDLLAEAKTVGAAFDAELSLETPGGPRLLHFAAADEDDLLVIVGESSKEKLYGAFDELSATFNEQLRLERETARQNAFRDKETFDEISKLNSELVDMQRELARKNAELRELNALKNRFLGMAAHDLRSPLSAIVLYSDFILDHQSTGLSEQQRSYLNIVRDSGRFMVSLIESLLDVAVIESGLVQLDRQAADIAALTRQVSTRMMPLASSRGITITCEASTMAAFYFDPFKIEQVLDNLLSNALKYSPPGSMVILRACQDQDSTTIEVSDDGPGIPLDEQASLFAYFSKGSTQSPHGEKAIGLGLAICKRIVEAHGGRIMLESEPGKGTTVRFRLPRNPAS